jgi:hypothetical protein
MKNRSGVYLPTDVRFASEGPLDFLVMFDSPWLNFCMGGFFLVAGAKRGKRRPPGSISSGAGSVVFAIVGLLLVANGLYLLYKFGS